MQWFWKNKIHFLIWAVFILYLLFANQLYATFILKNGKPLEEQVVLPEPGGEIRMHVDELRPIFYDGEDVYLMAGWVFSPDIPGSAEFKEKVVLHSVTHDLVFEAENISRKDLNEALPQYQMDLEYAGFRAIIAKDALRRENYKIGFVLEDAEGNVVFYQRIDQYIERLPNRLRFVNGS